MSSRMKILAIDYGRKRLGFAIGSVEVHTATPIDHWQRQSMNADISRIRTIIDDHDIEKIILGLPLNMDGSDSGTTIEVKKFYRYLKKKLPLEIEMVDERLTSFEAEELLKTQIKDYRQRKGKLDSMAAVVLLNAYFGES